jgi:outer membrane receptor protein involved in Fe transport
MGRSRNRTIVASTFAIAIASLSPPAAAQSSPTTTPDTSAQSDYGNDIIVTATKRSMSLQDVPFSINAQTAEDVQKSGASSLEDLSRNVAGLSIQNLGPGQSQVSVRGVSSGQIARDQPGVKEQVGVYLDESPISLSLFTPDLDLFDLDRVETLRGPQGTLFGSGSVGGTIRYITNQPKLGKVEGAVETGLNVIDGGSVGGTAKGAVNVPLGDDAAVRMVGYYTRYAGFIDAIGPAAGKNVNDGDRYGGRIALTYAPSANFSITPRIIYQRLHMNGFNRQEVFSLFANDFTTTRPRVIFDDDQQYLTTRESFDDKTLIADNVIKLGLGGVDFSAITTYTRRDILANRDESTLTGSVIVSPFASLGVDQAAATLPSTLLDSTKVNSWTQEVRLSSSGNGRFQWVVGAFYSDIKRFYQQRLPTPGFDTAIDAALGAGVSASVANGFPVNSPYSSDLSYRNKQFSVFGEANFTVGRLTLTAGGRYYDFKENRSIKTGGIVSNLDNRQDETSSNGFNPRFLLSYKASSDVTINAQASKGFRLGGVNDPLNAAICTPADRAIFGGYQRFRDESLWNYEGGVKVRSGVFTFNAAVFYNDMRNLQVTLDAGSCSSRVVFNVPKAKSSGVEFEATMKPIPAIELGVSGSLLDSKFLSTVVDGTGAVIGGIRDGNRLPSVPKFQVSANATFNFNLGPNKGYVTALYQHIGTRYTEPSDQEPGAGVFVHNLPYAGMPANATTVLDLKLPAYDIVNLSAGIDFAKGVTAILYVNNLFDKNALLAFDRERGGRARLGFYTNQPRTYGVTLRKTF